MPARPSLAASLPYIAWVIALVVALGPLGCSDDTGSDNNGVPDTSITDAGDASDDATGDTGDMDTGEDDAFDSGADVGDTTDAGDAGDSGDTGDDTSDAQDPDAGDTGTDTETDTDTGCADDDGDGVCNTDDICAGFDDTLDADGDGVPDDCDGCPDDTNKDAPGLCGCGFADPTGSTDCPNDPGDVDDTFAPGSTNGIQILNAPEFDEVRDAKVLADDTILLAGWRVNTPGGRDFLAAKLAADGGISTSFGSSGFAVVDFAGDTDRAYALAVDANNGFALVGHAVDTEQRAAVARFDAAGALDTSFSQDGKWTDTTFVAATLTGAEFTSTGALFVSGDYDTSPKSVLWGRLDTTGAWDTTFQTNGYATYSSGLGDLYASAAAADGSNYYLGGHLEDGAEDDFISIGLDSAGAFTSWGTSGIAQDDLSPNGPSADRIDALAVDGSGRVLAVGEFRVQSGEVDVAVARFDATGQLDTSFATDGFTTIDFGGLDRAFAVAVQPDGKVLVGGRSTQSFTDSAVVARLNADGTLDTTFQTDGKLTLSISTGTETEVRAIGLQTDKIIVVGNVDDGADQDIFVVRLFQ